MQWVTLSSAQMSFKPVLNQSYNADKQIWFKPTLRLNWVVNYFELKTGFKIGMSLQHFKHCREIDREMGGGGVSELVESNNVLQMFTVMSHDLQFKVFCLTRQKLHWPDVGGTVAKLRLHIVTTLGCQSSITLPHRYHWLSHHLKFY